MSTINNNNKNNNKNDLNINVDKLSYNLNKENKEFLNKCKNKFKLKTSKLESLIEEYDNKAKNLTDKAYNILEINCKLLYEEAEDYYLKNNLDINKDLDTPILIKYAKCKKFYINDLFSGLNYINYEFDKLKQESELNFLNCLNYSDYDSKLECYNKQYITYMLRFEDYFNNKLEFLNKKEKYLDLVKNYDSRLLFDNKNI